MKKFFQRGDVRDILKLVSIPFIAFGALFLLWFALWAAAAAGIPM